MNRFTPSAARPIVEPSRREALPHPLFEINRGGQATYHGPGQLVAYLLLDFQRYGQDLHRYLRWLETVLIELLAKHEIAGARAKG